MTPIFKSFAQPSGFYNHVRILYSGRWREGKLVYGVPILYTCTCMYFRLSGAKENDTLNVIVTYIHVNTYYMGPSQQ